MDCTFEKNADRLWQCTRKGCRWIYKIPSDRPPRHNCRATEQAKPPANEEEKAAAWEICRGNACGHYGHVGHVEICSIERCRQSGRMTHTPIEGLVDGLGCPKRLWPTPSVDHRQAPTASDDAR